MLYGLEDPVDLATTSCIAERFENGTHRTTGDDTGTGLGSTQQHLAGAVTAVHVMVQRAARTQRHEDQSRLADSVALRIASGTSRALP
jgi:hypothetical protein